MSLRKTMLAVARADVKDFDKATMPFVPFTPEQIEGFAQDRVKHQGEFYRARALIEVGKVLKAKPLRVLKGDAVMAEIAWVLKHEWHNNVH